MKNKAIFLDRDGTINKDTGYPYKIKDLRIIPKVPEGLKLFEDRGYKLIIVTNQSGIRRGYFTKEDYYNFQSALRQRLNKNGIFITGEYFCPHVQEDNCNCRKPKTGMLEEAAKDFDLVLEESWMIGDKSSDIYAGKNAGCKTIYILTEKDNIEQIKNADFVAKNLLEAANYLLNYENK